MMNPLRKRKLQWMIFIATVLTIVMGLILYALRQNLSLYYTPSQIQANAAPANHMIRVGGMVIKGSIVRKPGDLSVRFKITDYENTVEVLYHGILPDLFREGQGIVAQGKLTSQHQLQATQVLAKHDEKYMPPEVKSTLKVA